MKSPEEQIARALAKTTPKASNLELEQAIEDALVSGEVDPAARLLYGDWLQERGDPRGTLISCQPPHPSTEVSLRANATISENVEYFLGIFGDRRDLPLELSWRRGYIDTATLYVAREHEDDGWDQAMLTDALLSLPSARFIRELTLGCASIHEPAIDVAMQKVLLGRGPFPTLTTLRMITNDDEEMLSWTSAGDISHLGETAPNLRELHVNAGTVELGELGLPTLETLSIETCGMTVENLTALARAPWPELVSMCLWFGSASFGVDIPISKLIELLDAPMPKLTHLGLANNELTAEIIEVLAVHPILDQLKSIDLSKGTLDDAGAEQLLAHAAVFNRLKLDLRSNYINEQQLAIARALPRAELGRGYLDGQRQAEEWEGSIYRYASVGE